MQGPMTLDALVDQRKHLDSTWYGFVARDAHFRRPKPTSTARPLPTTPSSAVCI